jgi:hypothetical protein
MTRSRLLQCVLLLAVLAGPVAAQINMPDPKQISGVPLPASDVATGSVSVRVIRGSFANNVAGQAVEFTVDGKTRTVKTDDSGRALISGLALGAHLKAATVLDGKRLESQDITIAGTGLRVVLVGIDPEEEKRVAEDARLAAGPAVKGLVVLGPESRIITQLTDDRLDVFYVLQILNSARTPVDIGGPLMLDLPTEARGAALMDPSPKTATVTGAHLTVTGPFPPGPTIVNLAFELPFSGASVRLDQRWPVALQQVLVLVPQTGGIGGIDVQSPALTERRTASDQGQPLLVETGPGLAPNADLALEITGLPHHAVWPRDLALVLAGAILSIGIWAAVFPAPRPRHA